MHEKWLFIARFLDFFCFFAGAMEISRPKIYIEYEYMNIYIYKIKDSNLDFQDLKSESESGIQELESESWIRTALEKRLEKNNLKLKILFCFSF